MIVECDKCSTRFRIADERVTERGVKVRCGRCGHVFVVRREQLEAAGQAPPKSREAAAASLGFTTPTPAPEAPAPPPADVPPTPAPRSLSEAAPDPFSTAIDPQPSDDVDPFADIDLDAPSGAVSPPPSLSVASASTGTEPPPPPAASSERFPATLPSIPADELPAAPPPGPPKGMSADIPGLLDSSDPFSELELSGNIPSVAAYADTQASGGPALSITDSGSLTGLGAFDSSDVLPAPGVDSAGLSGPLEVDPPPDASVPYSMQGGLELAGPKQEAPRGEALGRIALKPRTTTTGGTRSDTLERQRLALLVTRGGEAWPTRAGALLGLLLALLLLTPWVPGTLGLRQALGLAPSAALPIRASEVEVVVYPRGTADPVPVVVGTLENLGAQPLTDLELVVQSEAGDALHFPLGRSLKLSALYRGESAKELRAQALEAPLKLAPGVRQDFSIAIPQLPVTALGAPLQVQVRRRGDAL